MLDVHETNVECILDAMLTYLLTYLLLVHSRTLLAVECILDAMLHHLLDNDEQSGPAENNLLRHHLLLYLYILQGGDQSNLSSGRLLIVGLRRRFKTNTLGLWPTNSRGLRHSTTPRKCSSHTTPVHMLSCSKT